MHRLKHLFHSNFKIMFLIITNTIVIYLFFNFLLYFLNIDKSMTIGSKIRKLDVFKKIP